MSIPSSRNAVNVAVVLSGEIVEARVNDSALANAKMRRRDYELSFPVAYADPKGKDRDDLIVLNKGLVVAYGLICEELLRQVHKRVISSPTSEKYRLFVRISKGDLREWHDGLFLEQRVIANFTYTSDRKLNIQLLVNQPSMEAQNASKKVYTT